MNIGELKIYLPKYLSSESEKELYQSLRDFPDNIDQRIYTSFLEEEPIIFQGDGLNDMLAIDLPNSELKTVPGIVLSNTCDIDQSNKRNFPAQIMYAPIVDFQKYSELLEKDPSLSEVQISGHLDALRSQYITQIFYLPKLSGVLKESIVFLDRVFNIGNDFVNRDKLKNIRLFTLSDFGNYLFLFKLSLHFTRIQDKVERKANSV